MAPKTKEFTPEVNEHNWLGVIVNPKKEVVPIEERKNREITLTPIDTTLEKLIGWNQEGADFIKEIKKASPNHRRNRATNKRVRAARRKNR